MKKERRITVLSIVINSLIVFIKIYAGLLFNSYTLVVSGYNTLCDMTLDFMGYSGSIARGRRASRRDPFGYGSVQSYGVMFLGSLISFLGLFIVVKAFFLKLVATDLKILFVLLIVVLVKILFSNFLFENAKSIQSTMLMDIAHASYYDGILTASNVFFIFLASIMPVFDLIGSLFMGAILICKGVNIVVACWISLKGQSNQSKKVIKKIEKIVKDGEGISYSNCNVVNVNMFYKVVIEILVEEDVSLHDLVLWEEYLKGNIKSEKINVKFVEFLVYKR